MTSPFQFPTELLKNGSILELNYAGSEALTTKVPKMKKMSEKDILTVSGMLKAMYVNDGIGIAGNQVVVKKPLRAIAFDPRRLTFKSNGKIISAPHAIFNPEIIDQSDEIEYEEGCLSFPEHNEKKTRFARVVVRGRDINWEEKEIEAFGLVAIMFQHEIDHLNGVTFIDHLSKLKKDRIIKAVKKKITTEKKVKYN